MGKWTNTWRKTVARKNEEHTSAFFCRQHSLLVQKKAEQRKSTKQGMGGQYQCTNSAGLPRLAWTFEIQQVFFTCKLHFTFCGGRQRKVSAQSKLIKLSLASTDRHCVSAGLSLTNLLSKQTESLWVSFPFSRKFKGLQHSAPLGKWDKMFLAHFPIKACRCESFQSDVTLHRDPTAHLLEFTAYSMCQSQGPGFFLVFF